MKRITPWLLLGATLALASCGDAGRKAAAAPNSAAGNAAVPPLQAAANSSDDVAKSSAQDFVLINETGHTVTELRVSPGSSNEWGPNLLGGSTLADRGQGQVAFPRGERQCSWNIQARYDNGTAGAWNNVNLCQTATIRLRAGA